MLMLVRGAPHHDHARSSTMTLGPSRASASSTIRRPGKFRGRVRVKVGLRLGQGEGRGWVGARGNQGVILALDGP